MSRKVELDGTYAGLNRRFLHFGCASGRNDGFVEGTKRKTFDALDLTDI